MGIVIGWTVSGCRERISDVTLIDNDEISLFRSLLTRRSINASPNQPRGQTTRLNFLLELLELNRGDVGEIGYQLVHRTASSIIEARRFGARHAVMLVHSFSQELEHFNDYAAFVSLYQQTATANTLAQLGCLGDVSLYLGWVVGNPEYLTR